MKKCGKLIQNISDYIDGEVDESICSELKEHLADCDNCRIMVDTLKQTFFLCRGGRRENLPESLQNRLNFLLKKKWDEKFNKDSS